MSAELVRQIKQLTDATKAVGGAYAEYQALVTSANVLSTDLKNSTLAFTGLFSEIQKLQKAAVVDLGQLGEFDKRIDALFKSFQNLNEAGKGFAITNENIKGTLFELTKAFEQSGIVQEEAIDGLTESIAKNTNLVEKSKLVKFVKDFSFQTNMGAKSSRAFQDELIGLSVALKRPPETLMVLAQNLLNSQSVFAASKRQIKDLAVESETLGRRFGVAGEKFNALLDSTFTIQDRQRERARLSKILTELNIFGVDTSGLLETDLTKRFAAFKKIAFALNRAAPGMDANVRRAAAFALQGTPFGRLGPQAIRAILSERRITEADLKPTTDPNTALDAARRRAATLAERTRIEAEAARVRQAREEMRQIRNLRISSTASLTTAANKASVALGKLSTDISKIAGTSAETLAKTAGAIATVIVQLDEALSRGGLRPESRKMLLDLKKSVTKLASQIKNLSK